jgi:glycosyltransferase involved in cell wall biosynthesis
MKIALVHDWLNQRGGAERVLEHLNDFFPHAPLYTSMFWREGMPPAYRRWDIYTTWMDRLPGIYRHHQLYFPFYALAFAHLDLRSTPSGGSYDLVLSNKSGFCHGIRTGDTPHLCYCLAPTRYVWEFDAYAARESFSPVLKVLLKPLVALLRRWDYRVAQRSTLRFVAISTEIQARIRRYYGRESVIVTPPVDTGRYQRVARHWGRGGAVGGGNYYLIVSRLIPYKRVDLAVRAFNQLGLPLVIAGSGRDRKALEAMADPNITFLGYVPDAELPGLLAGCRAFIFPGREDFGMTPVEAQAAGRPVIAYGAGGALDTVIEGVTGAFFYEQTPEALMEAVLTFDADNVDVEACRSNADRFSVARFRREIMALIEDTLDHAYPVPLVGRGL